VRVSGRLVGELLRWIEGLVGDRCGLGVGGRLVDVGSGWAEYWHSEVEWAQGFGMAVAPCPARS